MQVVGSVQALEDNAHSGESCTSEGFRPRNQHSNNTWALGTLISTLVAVAILLAIGSTPTDNSTILPSTGTNHRQLRQLSQSQSQAQNQNQTHQRELKMLQRDFVDCSKYEFTQSITGKLRLNYVVNVDESNPNKGTFSAEMVYQGEAWLGFAHSESGSMMGSMAVLGLPEAPAAYQVQKYRLGSPDMDQPSSIPQALPALQQTLLDTSLIQDGGTTILRFTKLLSEPDEQTIQPNWQNTFLFAHGTSNTLGYHETRGVLVLDLRPCVSTFQDDIRPPSLGRLEHVAGEDRYEASSNYVISIGNGFGSGNDTGGEATLAENEIYFGDNPQKIYPTEIPIPVDNDVPEQFTLDDDEHLANSGKVASPTSKPHSGRNSVTIWVLHGIFATLTCGILLPLILASSILPGCFGGESKPDPISDSKIYRWCNILVVVAVIATFVTAVVGASKDNPLVDTSTEGSMATSQDKPSSYHSPAGLGLFIVFLFFALAGTLRSFLSLTPKGLQDVSANNNHTKPNDFNSVDVKSVDKSLASLTWIFDNSHRLVGIILIFVSCWQCQTGLELFGERYESSWFTAAVFWGISGPILGVIGCLCVLQMVRYCHRLKHAFRSTSPPSTDNHEPSSCWLTRLLRSAIGWRSGATKPRTGRHSLESILGVQR